MLRVNMDSFRKNWRDYADNVRFGESIRNTNGVVLSLDYRGYVEWLNEFNVFYTVPLGK